MTRRIHFTARMMAKVASRLAVAHDGVMSGSAELVVVVTQRPRRLPGPLAMLRSAVGGVASTAVLAVDRVVSGTVNEALDRVVPPVLAAVLDRLDLTRLVIERVDLTRVVQATLDQMDLTQLVLDRVDVDRLVDEANLERIIDRLPLIDLANYIVDEIDLPRIIRESTGGIATDAMNAVRIQSIGVDQMMTRITDAILLRRKARATTAPGEAAPAAFDQEGNA
jgi:hypothetical protein